MRPPPAPGTRRPPARRRRRPVPPATLLTLALSAFACGGSLCLIASPTADATFGRPGVGLLAAAGVAGWFGAVRAIGQLVLGRGW